MMVLPGDEGCPPFPTRGISNLTPSINQEVTTELNICCLLVCLLFFVLFGVFVFSLFVWGDCVCLF